MTKCKKDYLANLQNKKYPNNRINYWIKQLSTNWKVACDGEGEEVI